MLRSFLFKTKLSDIVRTSQQLNLKPIDSGVLRTTPYARDPEPNKYPRTEGSVPDFPHTPAQVDCKVAEIQPTTSVDLSMKNVIGWTRTA